MQGIYDPNESFDFSKLKLLKPVASTGGNFFIRFAYLEKPLYIQPPKSNAKQGILKAGKRYYCDLLFSNEYEIFTRWMENLETHCQKAIFENRKEWFDGDMEMHDIENYFTSSLKSYKSGKFYMIRVNISPILGKPVLKIYDEEENDVPLEAIDDKMNMMSILEIQGIKCSAKSFQIEIELKQLMVLKPTILFEKCLLLNGGAPTAPPSTDTPQKYLDDSSTVSSVEPAPKHENTISTDTVVAAPSEDPLVVLEEIYPPTNNGLEEVVFHLDEIPKEETVQLKDRKDVYHEIYKQALKKAKMAREMAISAYLEAKQIKNTYMIEEFIDSDESDLDEDDDFNMTSSQEDPDEETDDEDDDDDAGDIIP
jgi:hypothetical protein